VDSKELIKYLKNSIGEKGNYCYSLPLETTKATIKCIKEQTEEIERLNNTIKEVKEYIEQLPFDDLAPIEIKVIYKILDKGSDKE